MRVRPFHVPQFHDLTAKGCRKSIEDDLNKGITIIADRYAFSGIAFSAAKVRQFFNSPLFLLM
jgi:thymidylate kinase